MLGQKEQLQIYQDRFRYLYLILMGVVVILSSRLWYLQILRGAEFYQVAEENRLKKIRIDAPRGMVFDRSRRLLLDNQPLFRVVITPQYFQMASKEEREIALEKLGKIVNMTPKAIDEKLYAVRRQPRFQPVVIKKNLSMNEVALVEMENLDLPGVDVQVGIQRTNVHELVGSQLMGYVAEVDADELPKLNKNRSLNPYVQGDYTGKAGLEQQWEDMLRGEDGYEYFEVDAFGKKKSTFRNSKEKVLAEIKPKPALPGNNIVLTIDEDLQKAAAEAFQKDGRTGAVVALDPNTGEVLSMLSWPSYNSTEFSGGIRPEYWKQLMTNEDKPLHDKTINDHYSPGSTFKIISAVAGLEEGLITANTVVNLGNQFMFGGRAYHDWKKEGHGPSDVVRSLYRSVDVFYYKLGTRLDIDVLSRYAKLFGLGQRTGLRMPGEVTGNVPSTEWKKKRYGTDWWPGETLSVIIGQSYLDATPIQLANMVAAIANGGHLYRPYLVKTVESPEGKVISTSKPELIRSIPMKDETLRLVRKGLEDVLAHPEGTARASYIPGLRVAGKTGTAQVIQFQKDKYFTDSCMKMERRFRHHGLFVAYAPVEDPKIAVAVVAEHSCGGATGAAPIAMSLIKTYMQKMDPAKYGPEALELAKQEEWKKRRGAVVPKVNDDDEGVRTIPVVPGTPAASGTPAAPSGGSDDR